MSFELILPFLRPIEPLLLDQGVSEIMGNPDASWSCERDGILSQEPTISFDAGRLRTDPVSTRINHGANDDEGCSAPVELAEVQDRLFS